MLGDCTALQIPGQRVENSGLINLRAVRIRIFKLPLLAELKQQLLEDEDGPGGAEDDEGLAAEEAEDRASQGRAQEALHHPLQEETGTGSYSAAQQWHRVTPIGHKDSSG